MKFSLFHLLFAALFLLGGCKKTGSLDVVFEAKMNGAAIVSGDQYDYQTGRKMNFEKVAGFFTVVSIIKNDGSEVALGDYDYLNLTDGSGAVSVGGIDAGDFSKIKIGFGLPASLNSTNPNGLKTSDPRTVNGRNEWWGGWKSYIFSKIEGRFDSDGDGQLETGLSYHCGSDAIYREVVFDKNFSIQEDENAEVRFVFEVSDFLKEAGQPLDLVQKPKTSDDADNVALAKILVENWSSAIKIQ